MPKSYMPTSTNAASASTTSGASDLAWDFGSNTDRAVTAGAADTPTSSLDTKIRLDVRPAECQWTNDASQETGIGSTTIAVPGDSLHVTFRIPSLSRTVTLAWTGLTDDAAFLVDLYQPTPCASATVLSDSWASAGRSPVNTDPFSPYYGQTPPETDDPFR